MEVDRIKDWRKFSEYMAEQYLVETVRKYAGRENAPDLMVYTDKRVCIWNILKYALRLWNKEGKEHDFEKIAHYASMAWGMKMPVEFDVPYSILPAGGNEILTTLRRKNNAVV